MGHTPRSPGGKHPKGSQAGGALSLPVGLAVPTWPVGLQTGGSTWAPQNPQTLRIHLPPHTWRLEAALSGVECFLSLASQLGWPPLPSVPAGGGEALEGNRLRISRRDTRGGWLTQGCTHRPSVAPRRCPCSGQPRSASSAAHVHSPGSQNQGTGSGAWGVTWQGISEKA